jgi:hypothetical protein
MKTILLAIFAIFQMSSCKARPSDSSEVKVEVSTSPASPPTFRTAELDFEKIERYRSQNSASEWLRSGQPITNWPCITADGKRGTINVSHKGNEIEILALFDNPQVGTVNVIYSAQGALILDSKQVDPSNYWILWVRGKTENNKHILMSNFRIIEKSKTILEAYCY